MSSKQERGGIPTQRIPKGDKPVKFSFKHFDPDHHKFSVISCSNEFFVALLSKLQLYSSLSLDDFVEQYGTERRHMIVFEDTTEPKGFVGAPGVDEDQLGYSPAAWQFAIQDKQEWRVHGLLIDDTFYLIWLDPLHLLYQR